MMEKIVGHYSKEQEAGVELCFIKLQHIGHIVVRMTSNISIRKRGNRVAITEPCRNWRKV
ncbi:hypothetical protein FE810_00725 [Thalassotalea litorea]|uniref:Uncharacterized protein n=1 Tax=Thalassotalea litorea TaxID=2020715 RepID=A0A5R9ISA1_9GAMM|nr:hypothetical protein [Thalassotalea litorea]TLU67509.1 hypothetical protein FE810_00725 [Thalassotalea litorea]